MLSCLCAANPSNPAHEVTFPPNYVDLYEQKPKAMKSFDIRISPLLGAADIKPQNNIVGSGQNHCLLRTNEGKKLSVSMMLWGHNKSLMTFENSVYKSGLG